MLLQTAIAGVRGGRVKSEDSRNREESMFASCMSAVDIIAAVGTCEATGAQGPNAAGLLLMRRIRKLFSREPRRPFVTLKISAKKRRKLAGYRRKSRLERQSMSWSEHEANTAADAVLCGKCSHVLLDRAA